ncbi:MAG: SDR family NAD(P)-dependent oxidoreductase [Bacteroidota bacterium]
MDKLRINVAYTADNQNEVNQLLADLAPVGVDFLKINGQDFVTGESFYDRLVRSENPCFLIISDNFLKSIACLTDGLNYLQALMKNNQVIPIITDGVTVDAEGNRTKIPTAFEKVSNVIKYMNYWQEKYLDLRKLKRTIPAEEEEHFAAKLKKVRSISSEVGEFLRNLRDSNYYRIDDFSANDYEAFFNNFSDEASHQYFKNNRQHFQPVVVTTSEVLVEDSEAVMTALAEESKFPPPPEVITVSKEPSKDTGGVIEIEEVISVKTERIVTDSPEKVYVEEKVEDLVANDPEWLEATEVEATDEIVESIKEEETPLEIVAEEGDRPLTETEQLALELARQLPNASISKEEEGLEEEEEMISLEDLLGEDALEKLEEEAAERTILTDSESLSIAESPSSNFVETDDMDETEDELEGYFMDEGEETEEIIEELSEFEVLQSANTLVQSGKVNEGISLLSETLEEAPDFISVRYQYAAFLAKYQNNFKEASNQLATLLEYEPNNLSAKFFLGELAEAERDYLTAKGYFEKVHEENPEFPNVAYKLGMLQVNQLREDLERGASYLAEAYGYNSHNVNALYQLGVLQSEALDEPDLAIQAFEETVKVAPEHPFANYDLALIYYAKGEKELAKAYYEKAGEINPELRTTANDQAFSTSVMNEAITDLPEEIDEKIGQALADAIQPQIKEETTPINGVIAENSSIKLEEPEPSSQVEEEIGRLISAKSLEEQKTILITGATAGIGRATAEKFAQNGHRLILTGRRFSRLFQIKDQFEKEYGTSIQLLPFDVKDADAVKNALAELEDDWQDVDLLINNAGLAKGSSPIHEGDLAHWETMIDTNIKGLLYMTRQIAPKMVKRRSGHIINICSLAGKEVYPNNAVYCATKHAVDALTKAMRIDLLPYDIRVSQVSPGFVEETEFSFVKNEDEQLAKQTYEDFVPVNAKDVAEVIYFMATQPAHVTLQEVVLTGTQQANANMINRSGR